MAAALSMGAAMPAPISQKKVFVGGLSWETDEQSLRDYFAQYGPVSDCVIMRDRVTGHPRGFGFVTYDDQIVAERVAAEFHELDGRQVEAKIAVPRSECVPAVRSNAWRATKKVFVGGLPATCREPELHAHFIRFGEIAECQVMYDHQTGNSRGFGFVTFTSEATVDRVVDIEQHDIMAKHVEVKRAEPKQALEARRGREAAAALSNSLSPPPPPSMLVSPQKQQQLQQQPHHLQQQTHPPSASSIPYGSNFNNPSSVPPARSPPTQSPFQNYGPWSSLFSGPGSSWNNLLATSGYGSAPVNDATQGGLNAQPSNASAASAQPQSSPRPGQSPASHTPPGGMGFFTPAQTYPPDLAQCAYNAFYNNSTPQGAFGSDLSGAIPSARVERRFHPYSTRERIERSYR